MVWREKLDMCSKQCKKILILRFYRSFFPVKETTKRQLTEPWQHSEKAPLQLNDYSFMSSPTAWTQQLALWLCSFVNYQKAETAEKTRSWCFHHWQLPFQVEHTERTSVLLVCKTLLPKSQLLSLPSKMRQTGRRWKWLSLNGERPDVHTDTQEGIASLAVTLMLS